MKFGIYGRATTVSRCAVRSCRRHVLTCSAVIAYLIMSLTSLFKKNRTEESVTDPSGKSSGDVEMHVMDDSATAAMSPKSASSSADIQKQSNAAAEEVHGECSDIRGVFSVVLSAIGKLSSSGVGVRIGFCCCC